MIKFLPGDLIESDCPVICHQVNCKGVMGAGIARQIRKKYPVVYEKYAIACRGMYSLNLGRIQPIKCKDRICINIFAQNDYGCGKQFTNYTAFASCIQKIVAQGYTRVGFPYKIGCGLAGGDWNIILEILHKYFDDSKTICEIYSL